MSKTSSILNLSLEMSHFSQVKCKKLTNSTCAVDCMLSLITMALSNNPAGILSLATQPYNEIKSRGKLTPFA